MALDCYAEQTNHETIIKASGALGRVGVARCGARTTGECMGKVNGKRVATYLLGMVVLALGLTLNAKSSLGMSPIISVAWNAGEFAGWSFANATLVLYFLFILVQMALHVAASRRDGRPASWLRASLLKDLLQLPLSIVFTRFLDLFVLVIPAATGNLPLQLVLLAAAVVLTGIGAATTLNMRLIPNPGDGIVQGIADFVGRETGFVKNFVDLSCLGISLVFGPLVLGHLSGIGLGTIVTALGVGRVIAAYNGVALEPLQVMAGLLDKAGEELEAA